VKWLTDWVKDYGVDGFRVDTAKHVEADIWSVLKKESEYSLASWKMKNPSLVKDDLPFYLVGEVFNWGVDGFRNTAKDGRSYDYGDKQVDFFNYGFDALINMGFATHAEQSPEQIFSSYSKLLNQGALKDVGVLNYIGSHDDIGSFDRARTDIFTAAFKLMLAPGGVQIYYGDEVARPMYAEDDVFGDAHLRTMMDWQSAAKPASQKVLAHWQKLGQFRQSHDAVGSGIHKQLNETPYIFQRTLGAKDRVLVAKDLTKGEKTISVYRLFNDGDRVYDFYSNQTVIVKNGNITVNSDFTYLLIGKVIPFS